MLRSKSRVLAAMSLCLLYLNAGSVAMGVEVRGLLVGNAEPFCAVSDGGAGNSELAGGFSDRHVGAIDDHAPVVSPVSLLGIPVSPSAIPGLVIALAPDAIQSKPIWGLAHISEEVLERVEPALANLNAASAVEPELFRFRVVAALLHPAPAIVGAGIFGPAAMPVCALPLGRTLAGQATARLRVAAPEILFINNSFTTAGAAA